MFNILLGGAAGQGVETTGAVIEKILKSNGYNVFVTRDLMSRVRGGHNFSTLRFGRSPVIAHDHAVDGILAQLPLPAHTGAKAFTDAFPLVSIG